MKNSIWQQGYDRGCAVRMDEKIEIPSNLSEKEKRMWRGGFDAAICDRLS